MLLEWVFGTNIRLPEVTRLALIATGRATRSYCTAKTYIASEMVLLSYSLGGWQRRKDAGPPATGATRRRV